MFRRAIRRLALAALLIFPSTGLVPVTAQEVQRIAAVVNDDVISVFDLVQRMKLVIVSSGLQNSPEVMQRLSSQVLRSLIDERLRMQEATRNNISVSEPELANAIANVEKRNKVPADGLEEYLKSREIDPNTVISQLKVQIVWGKLMRQRMRAGLTVTDDDVDDELARLEASQGTPEYRFSEIFLVVESIDQDTIVRQNAERLVEQLRAGAKFGVLARQFSEGASAGQGGDVGWVSEDQLAEEVATLLATLEPGRISQPIRTSGGYLIVQRHDRRLSMVTDLDEAKVTLKQVVLQVSAADGEESRQLAAAESIRKTVGDCNDMDRAAADTEFDMSGDLGTVRLKDLPPDLREVVRALPVGTVSAPVRTKLGVQLLMVCDRTEPASTLPGRETVRNTLMERQFELVSRRYLRNLRRDAFVDIRI